MMIGHRIFSMEVAKVFSLINCLPVSDDICHLLVIFANRLEPDQESDWNWLVL